MPNILKRPMFRRGGSAAEGTGITSGLSERRNYSTGGMDKDGVMIGEMGGIGPGGVVEELIVDPTRKLTKEEADKIALSQLEREANQTIVPEIDPRGDEVLQQLGVMRAVEESMAERSPREAIGRSLTGLATAGPKGTEYQTIADFARKYGTTVAGLEKTREDALMKFRGEAGLQILKNMTNEEKDQLFRYAKKYAETTGIPVEQAYKMFLDRYLQGTPSKGLTTDRLISDYQKTLLASPSLGYGAGDALVVAKTQAAIFEGKAKGHEGANPSPVKIYNNQASGRDFKGYRYGDKFINPADGGIYMLDVISNDGKTATFTKVWPTK